VPVIDPNYNERQRHMAAISLRCFDLLACSIALITAWARSALFPLTMGDFPSVKVDAKPSITV
jgi:hypothetical protein